MNDNVIDSTQLRTGIGKVLKKIRKREGIGQQQLAEKAQLSKNGLSLIETGRVSASIETIFRICIVLEIEVSDFIKCVEDYIDRGF